VCAALHLFDHCLADVGRAMAEEQGAMAHPVVDVAVTIDVPLVGAFGTLDVHRERLHASIVVGHPVGKDRLGACKELPRVG
jgi:hypothetical protein